MQTRNHLIEHIYSICIQYTTIIHGFCLCFSVSSWYSVCQINLRVLFPVPVFMPKAVLKKENLKRDLPWKKCI